MSTSSVAPAAGGAASSSVAGSAESAEKKETRPKAGKETASSSSVAAAAGGAASSSVAGSAESAEKKETTPKAGKKKQSLGGLKLVISPKGKGASPKAAGGNTREDKEKEIRAEIEKRSRKILDAGHGNRVKKSEYLKANSWEGFTVCGKCLAVLRNGGSSRWSEKKVHLCEAGKWKKTLPRGGKRVRGEGAVEKDAEPQPKRRKSSNKLQVNEPGMSLDESADEENADDENADENADESAAENASDQEDYLDLED